MVLENARQEPYATSFVGVLKGAANYYGLDLTPGMAFGAIGHAFLMNIHDELCPSGPYVFDPQPIYRLARNVGLEIENLGFFHSESDMTERTTLEESIERLLNAGIPCGVSNMDWQLINGYSGDGILLSQPWGDDDPTTPPQLSYGTWVEFGEELHCDFIAVRKTDPAEIRHAVTQSLEFATEIYRHPARYTEGRYGMGANAYANWIHALQSGHGGDHGAWWNSQVWSECRRMAADYLTEIGDKWPACATIAGELSGMYRSVATSLTTAGNRELDQEVRLKAVEHARDTEHTAIEKMPALINLVGTV